MKFFTEEFIKVAVSGKLLSKVIKSRAAAVKAAKGAGGGKSMKQLDRISRSVGKKARKGSKRHKNLAQSASDGRADIGNAVINR